jgi:phosphoribosylamine--glycine ligase
LANYQVPDHIWFGKPGYALRVLVIGGGGREHALVWKLAQSSRVQKIYCAPGNAGIASLAECVPIKVEETGKLLEFARDKRVDLTVVGPEAPLMGGIVNLFTENKQLIFGPCREGALLEGSKVYSKKFMRKYGIPTAGFEVFTDPQEAYRYLGQAVYPLVVKADGLAAGKGVVVAQNHTQANEAVKKIMEEKVFGSAGENIVIEEFLDGEEVSVFAITDGTHYKVLPSAQDHKAAYDGDRGPNTGGMGAYSPAPILTPELTAEVKKSIFNPVLRGLRQEGITYRGVIYGGLMVTPSGLKVLEFNVRFGDPEAQVLIPCLKTDLFTVFYAAARGELGSLPALEWHDCAAVCVVIASGGYPHEYEKGKEIKGIRDTAGIENTVVFHAGTAFVGDRLVTAGGRVLGCTAWDRSLKTALEKAYLLTEKVSFEGSFYRKDIARKAFQE